MRTIATNLQRSNVSVVNIAPAPVFAPFSRLNQRVLRFMKVATRMAILRRIAAADVAALEAHPKMHPCITHLQAFFTTLGARLHFLRKIRNVRAFGSHGNLPAVASSAFITPLDIAAPVP
jgi:hypothetical protein